MRRLLFLMVGVLLALVPVRADEPAFPSGLPFDLLQRSLKTSSAAERAIIRAHLAKVHPSTPEGLFSAAWIADVEGRDEDSQRLYRKTIEEDPELTVAYINLALSLERNGKEKEALAAYDEALQTAPFDVDLVRNGFFLRKKFNGDTVEAMRFLDEWQGKVGNLDYDFDFVRALDAETQGEYAKAERFYERAISKDAPFAVYERLANLRLNHLSDEKMPPAERLVYVTREIEPLLERDRNADAGVYVGRLLRDHFDLGGVAFHYFSKAFDIAPSAETAGEIFTQLAGRDFQAAREFLEKADKALPDNFALKADLAWMHYQFLGEPDRAGELALESLALAPHDAARMEAIRQFGHSRQAYGRFDEAQAFYVDRLKQEWPQKMRNRLLRMAAENSIAAQRFADAKVYLDVLDIQGDYEPAWVKGQIALVNRALALEAAKTAEPVSGGLSAAAADVLFAIESDVIPDASFDALDALADDLKAQGEDAPVLSIEGYADSTGSFAGNEGLSYRRAKAVQAYLVEKHGIKAQNLRIAGFGTRFPAATNTSREGRAQNRRVEIWPLGKDTQSTRPDALKGNVYSPDGRHAVFGQSPPQIWDMRSNTGRAKLYRGRNFRFSPDGRLVSSISSYREENGTATEAFYIYDAADGHVIAQLHEPLEIVEQAWRPDGGAVAFATGDGFLKIYDLETRRLKVARMGPVRIGGPLVWLADGKSIATAQHRMKEVVLWDVETLQPVERFGGVNWPHAMGASPDGRYLLVFDNRMMMHVRDLQRNNTVQSVKVPMIPLDVWFHPQRPWVVFNAKFEGSDVSLAVMDFSRMRNIAQWNSGGTYAFGLSNDGETVAAASGNRMVFFNTATLEAQDGGGEQ